MSAFRKIAVSLILLAGWCLSVGAALAEKRVALIIGNSTYDKVARLGNPANDAALMSETLKSAGFDSVELRRDLKIGDMRRALRDFVDKARDADVAVVYYAGHGIEVDGINYLIPVDAVLERDIDVYDETLSLDRVLVSVEPARQLRLVILDACRDNPFTGSMKRTVASRAVGRGLAKIEPTSPNTLVAFASKAGSTASDGDGKNSPFTAALVKHVTKPGLDLRKAFGYARDDVLKSTGNRQEPYVYGSLGGDDFPLVPAKPVSTGALADPQAAVRRDYELALQLGTRDGWDAFLSQHPDGFYANLAKGQLRKIAAEEARAAAAEKSLQAEQEKARLAAEGARQAEQAKAAATSKVAAEARTAAEKAEQIEQQKAAAAEKARLAAQEKARLATEEKTLAEKAEGQKIASLQPSSSAVLSPSELVTSLQLELRRVGCMAALATGEWSTPSERSLGLFNRYANTQFNVKQVSVDALDTVKGKTGRICPLICESGFRADGDRCLRIACRTGYEVNDDGSCRRVEVKKKPTTKRNEENPARAQRAPTRSASSTARADTAKASGSYKACMGPRSGCYERSIQSNYTPQEAKTWCSRRPTC